MVGIGIRKQQPLPASLLRAFLNSMWFTGPTLRQVIPQAQYIQAIPVWMRPGQFIENSGRFIG